MSAKTDHPQYRLYRTQPPTGCGNGCSSAYHKGYAGHRNLYPAGSWAWAAWWAGKDNAKQSSK